MGIKREAFLQKDYELKITYLTNQFIRMWTRFNYFVAIETALVGGKFLIPSGCSVESLQLPAQRYRLSAISWTQMANRSDLWCSINGCSNTKSKLTERRR